MIWMTLVTSIVLIPFKRLRVTLVTSISEKVACGYIIAHHHYKSSCWSQQKVSAVQADSRGWQVEFERTSIVSGAGFSVQVFRMEPLAGAGAAPGWRVHLRQWTLSPSVGWSTRQSGGWSTGVLLEFAPTQTLCDPGVTPTLILNT